MSAVAAVGLAAGGCASPPPRPRLVSANEKLNIAIVGYGGKGASDADCCASQNIVALCDADDKDRRRSPPATPQREVLPGLPANAGQGKVH